MRDNIESTKMQYDFAHMMICIHDVLGYPGFSLPPLGVNHFVRGSTMSINGGREVHQGFFSV
jgi:hypothetical protein